MYQIAIDGPAGVGKSTLAKALAHKLGFVYVDTGALYRTVALHLLNNDIAPSDEKSVAEILPLIKVEMKHLDDGQHVFLCGEDVSNKIRSSEVSMAASTSSALPCVRAFLLSLQTDIAEKHNIIMDGRDIGTVVLKNAHVKIFLTASAKERATRRFDDLKAKGIEEDFDSIYADVLKRDEQDSNRAIAPLKPAEDAVIVDSTEYVQEQTLAEIMRVVKEKIDV